MVLRITYPNSQPSLAELSNVAESLPSKDTEYAEPGVGSWTEPLGKYAKVSRGSVDVTNVDDGIDVSFTKNVKDGTRIKVCSAIRLGTQVECAHS